MTLYQLLRYVLDTTPLVIFDIEGKLICKIKSKHSIDEELLDYKVFRISAITAKDYFDNDSYVCVMLEK